MRATPALALNEAYIASPARRLQQDLHSVYGAQNAAHYSPRVVLPLVVLANSLCWVGIIYGIRALV